MFLYVVIGLCSFIVGGFVVGLCVMLKMDKPPIGAINIFYNDYGEDPYIYLEVYPGMSKDLFEGKKANLDIKTVRYKPNPRK